MIGELLARGGADYRSEWSMGCGRRRIYARVPVLSVEFLNPKHKKNANKPILTPTDNPLVNQLIAAKPQCVSIVGFDNITAVKAIYKRAIELHLEQIDKAASNPYALSPKRKNPT